MPNNRNFEQFMSQVVLGNGQNGDSIHVDITGARAVAFTVKGSDAQQLTTASPQVLMTDDRQVTCTPGALPAGTSQAAVGVNAAGTITGADLSTTTPRIVFLRAAADTGFNVESSPKMYGVKQAWLTLTRAAVTGTTTYTVVTTVYY